MAVPCSADDKDVVKVKFSNLWDTFVAHCRSVVVAVVDVVENRHFDKNE